MDWIDRIVQAEGRLPFDFSTAMSNIVEFGEYIYRERETYAIFSIQLKNGQVAIL